MRITESIVLGLSAFLLCGVLMAAEARGEETHSGIPAITIRSLLAEMIDRDSIARWPLPPFACKQQSSYDRHRTGPDKPDWFSNHDFSQYMRVEKHEAREEHVMMEADGPGAIVRIWITTDAISGILRVYLDGAEEPTIEFAAYDLMQGGLDLTPPLLTPHTSYQANAFGGSTLYLPIPYAKQCKITLETRSKPRVTIRSTIARIRPERRSRHSAAGYSTPRDR